MDERQNISALRAWRLKEGLTLDAAAAAVGCSHRAVWYDWEIGRRIPERDNMLAIYRLTGGTVQPNDFYELPALQQQPLPLPVPERHQEGEPAEPELQLDKAA